MSVIYMLSPQWLCGNSCTWAHDIYICQSFKEINLSDVKNCLTLVEIVEFLNRSQEYKIYAIKAMRPFSHASCCAYKLF